ncbi:flagellar basal body-associated FliL family protein [uncultured Tateyamaria sp.]|uniref:flagellar basal body-associated FliL family protein n=1 Tax=uncultured Tateyamaria sp. TaxID=455651 RepID=UPI00260DE488|nr:flagellar basal body-associated FliL family protein [uncultured Tateyamaria sp.]
MKKLLPLVLILIGTGAGVGAGIYLRPEPDMTEEGVTTKAAKSEAKMDETVEDGTHEYFKMSNQLVVPVIKEDRVKALVVMSLSLEVPVGQKDVVYAREPRLRDSFLRVLFDHSNIGGFDGAFTNPSNLNVVRNALKTAAQRDLGERISDVLIVEIARQDY